MLYFSEKSFCKSLGVAYLLLLFYFANLGGNDNYYVDSGCDCERYSVTSSLVCDSYRFEEKQLQQRIYRELDYYICNADNYYRNLQVTKLEDTEEQIEEEIREGEMEMLAQLIEAEAGNQDLTGKILVGDVVMNRCHRWSMSVKEVIFMDYQFACVKDGGFDEAGWHISQESFEAAERAYTGNGMDDEILFFTAGGFNEYCIPGYKYGDHYFGY